MTIHSKTVGMIGLGLMGTAMTERLLEHGYAVRVWNRSREKADPLIRIGAVWSDNPLRECDRVIVSLYSSAVVAEVIHSLHDGLHQGQIVIDTTTGEPQDVSRLAEQLRSLGVTYFDAPISGSSEQTRHGDAVVFVGGNSESFEACADLWQVLGKAVFHTGDTGSASRMKLVSNLVLGLNRVVLAEGLTYAAAMGVNPSAALEILKASAAYSKVMEIKGDRMLRGDFRPQARLSQHLKDVRIILETATAARVRLPLSSLHCALLEQAERLGCGELDNSSIIRVYQNAEASSDAGEHP